MFPRTVLALFACAVVGYFLGRTRGMGLQGFFMGLAFGPLGWGLVLLWPTSWVEGPVPRQAAPRAAPEDPPTGAFRNTGGQRTCTRCRHPVSPDAGACPKCGNVLVPIHYQVETP